MTRPFNFSAGPANLPEEVLKQAAGEMLDWHGSGMSVMEMSHRGKEFISIYEAAEADFRELMAVPTHFKILFMQGGGLAENAIVPLNLSRGRAADFVVTGSWSDKSQKEARKYCDVQVAASNADNGHTQLPSPSGWKLRPDAAYVHLCTNETINGVEFQSLPDLKALGSDVPLVIDFSSHVASRPVDWSRVGLAFGGAQKNLGPAGVTLAFIKKDFTDRIPSGLPAMLDYKTHIEAGSLFNTPPCYSIYIVGLVLQWIQDQGGADKLYAANAEKAKTLYDYLDASKFFYSPVEKSVRSLMNVPFLTRVADAEASEALNKKFVKEAEAAGLVNLAGHRSVGGMRASIYNAMPLEGVKKLVEFLKTFEKANA
jgi:phosphoserine aminotransferase